MTILVLNFSHYLFDDWRTSQSTLLPDATLLETATADPSIFDELGWFSLLFLLKVETNWIEHDTEIGPVYWLMLLWIGEGVIINANLTEWRHELEDKSAS